MPYAHRNGSRLRYVVDGSGPDVFLHHAFADGLEVWEEQGWVERLTRHFRVVRFDALGHGRSSKPYASEAYAMAQRVADVLAVMDAAESRSAHYVGYSLGGRVGFELASAAPERIRSLALGGAHPFAQSMAPQRHVLRGGMDGLVTLLEALDGPLPDGTRLRLLGNDPVALAAAVAEDRPDRRRLLGHIYLPTLLFVGSEDPLRSKVERAALEVSGSHLLQVSGLEHMALALHLGDVLPAVQTFLLRASSSEL